MNDLASIGERELHPIVVLSKYFTWAVHMKGFYFKGLAKATEQTEWNTPESVESFMYLSLWYATFYVVVEGWRDLELADAVIDELLKSPNVEMLRLYRNGVFHFQKTYFDQKYMHLITQRGSAEWVQSLHQAFFSYFQGWFSTHFLDGSLKI